MSRSASRDVPTTGIPTRVDAALIDAPGAQPRVATVDLPARTPESSVLRVLAAPVNPLDLHIASGRFHSAQHQEPYVPGSECVGVVLASERYTAGTLVYTQYPAAPGRPGSLATHVVVDDDDLLALPDGLDPILAAAVGNSGVAAYTPLIEIAGLRAGETVLVLGATGVVGQLAVQVARSHGAGRVIGVGRNRSALDRLGSLGADAVVALLPDEPEDDLAARLSRAAGPVDVVLDGLYGVPLQAALRTCAPHARVVNIGNSAGSVAHVSAGSLRARQLVVTGYAGLHTSMQAKQKALTWLWQHATEGGIRLDIHKSALSDIAATWSAQSASPHAKCVVVPS